ncbi:MAG: metallophosphoesterase, partial [Actinobacteria bacterium]|nr:metallophosphoesterase [Actinomycetota bacterium]
LPSIIWMEQPTEHERSDSQIARAAGGLVSILDDPIRIAQISDIHCGEPMFEPEMMKTAIRGIEEIEPDLVVIAGDLTAAGYEWEFKEAAEWIDRINFPKVIIPGNHDARNVGYIHFENLFGDRFTRYRQGFDDERAERLGATGFTVVAVDSSEPDLNDGRVGREYYSWITEQFDEPDDYKIFVIHHHLVPIPGTGRERNIILDAGDVLAVLTQLDIDVVLSGHKHVPYFWGLNGMLLCNSSTACTRRVRGLTPPSWNELQLDASTIKCYTHYPDGRRDLSLIFSLKTREMTREVFYLTDSFIESNRLMIQEHKPLG